MKKADLKKAFKISLIFTATIWAVFVLNLIIPYNFSQLGINPRSYVGLKGIILSPFIHAGIFHILSNTLPLFILSFLLFLFYKRRAFMIFFLILGLTGSAVWLMARGGGVYHVGASGVIYGLATFLITAGFYLRSVKELLLSIVIIIAYGGLIWGVFPTRNWVSWESHLFGAAAGIVVAIIFSKAIKKEKRP